MDIDIETLITLLFTIIFIALGVLGQREQNVKKVPELETEDEEERLRQESEDFKKEVELIREGYYEEDRETVADELSEYSFMEEDLTQKKETYGQTVNEQEKYREPSKSKKLGSIEDYIKMSEMDQKTMEKTGQSLTQKLKKEFDPRKAMLYMEILHRKY